MRILERKIDFKSIIKNYDYTLLVAYILICLFSLVMIYSSSMVVAIQRFNIPGDTFFKSQLISFIISFFALIFVSIIPYQWYKTPKFLMFVIVSMFLLLISVKVFGEVKNNAKSWLTIFGFSFQPSEYAKLGIILYIAAFYAKKQKEILSNFKIVLSPIVFVLIIVFLVAKEPDFGAVIIISSITLVMMLCSGFNSFKIAGIYAFVAAVVGFIFFNYYDVFLSGEKLNRVKTYLDPFNVNPDNSRQIINSFLAIAAGGVEGLGLGNSVQKLGYLSYPYTDFIIAIISEELGIFGVLFVIGIIGYFIFKGINIGIRMLDAYGSLLAIGISGMIAIQAVVNLGGATGLLPLTGVTLPFVSSGGSSLLILSIALGILINISTYKKELDRKYKKRKA